MKGYYRQPSISKDRVVFVSEDDLWEMKISPSADADGVLHGFPRRLTRGRGAASYPAHSPDGKQIAYVGTDRGATDIYVMDSRGGPARQLTFNGAMNTVVGWTPDGSHIVFRSNSRAPFRRSISLFKVPVGGGEATRIPVGLAHSITFNGSGRVIARHADDLARWKRYRGGTAGVLWIDADGSGNWERLRPQFVSGKDSAGLVRPMWIGERVYFLSDEEGYANLYSCLTDGSDLTRHTEHIGFYARFAATDGESIVYTVGGDLWHFDVASGKTSRIECDYASPRDGLRRKYVDAEDYLDSFALHPRGHRLAVTTRGKLFDFGNWEGATRQLGEEQGVRYRLATYLNPTSDAAKNAAKKGSDRIVVCSDAGGEERLEIHRVDGARAPVKIDTGDFKIGRPIELKVSPTADEVVLTNHRHELVHLDLGTGKARVLDRSKYAEIKGFDWSADGRWVAYAVANNFATAQVRIYDLHSDAVHPVTSGDYLDIQPVFDPKGRYLYFLSYRKFNPVYDEIFFELSFPRAMKPCVVTLRDDVPSLFMETPRPLDEDPDDDDDDQHDEEEDSEESPEEQNVSADENAAESADGSSEQAEQEDDAEDDAKSIEIDFEGIEHRVEIFPGREGNYDDLAATESRIFWTVSPIEGSLGGGLDAGHGHPSTSTLRYYSLNKHRTKTFARGVSGVEFSADLKTIALWTDDGLQVVSAGGEGPIHSESDDATPSRSSGFIDLGRLSVPVEPRAEWEQMLHETWRLMREHFWRADMNGVDWDEVWQRYSALLDRVGTRGEFSDLVWTMQGELGTSHAYEIGGDYEPVPYHQPGFLGADLVWDPDFEYTLADEGDADAQPTQKGGYRIQKIVAGETWDPRERSPLARPGIDVAEDDVVIAINGQRVDASVSVEQRLLNHAGKEVEIVVIRKDGECNEDGSDVSDALSRYTIKTLPSESAARYREWVYKNRKRVHEASEGKLGYVHIPDMGPEGFAEFHRAYVSENTRKGLVVDVRYNGGGHVSQLLLEKLARRPIGYDIQRWGTPVSYPQEAVCGPLVALTNEHAGSDGDIFSHSFKLMGLGPLLGKRTWGGVVGIWPRHALVDGSITTQPEFSFWFEDVGFSVENWGTDPDIEVENPPGVEDRGEDPQLDAAIAKALELLKEQNTDLPEFAPYPNMAPPGKLD
ncbi:S41 family peptidase [Bradymonas sediminis]|uniref:Tricorn protease homolog n=1 Tax=Bradymonas sediminis TaxID=1548548 RepID=A0A2Z4FG04_9DELT|nr:S41 family peptidase [Bradymonas sediminis]AWV87827.1 peptidase [Bradymonas sediminis]TDP73922.1 tricorn protease [Bradymonas sediminis]